jgi:hypothetical protein
MFEYSGCGPFDPRFCSPDPFYQSSGEIDSLRVPLLDPYEAIKINDGGWFIDLNPYINEEFCLGINDAKKISIESGRVYVYSDYVQPEGINVEVKNFHWFIMDVVEGKEIVFDTEEEFLQYQQENGYEDPQWMTLDDTFTEFEGTGCLPWVPGCEESK